MPRIKKNEVNSFDVQTNLNNLDNNTVLKPKRSKIWIWLAGIIGGLLITTLVAAGLMLTSNTIRLKNVKLALQNYSKLGFVDAQTELDQISKKLPSVQLNPLELRKLTQNSEKNLDKIRIEYKSNLYAKIDSTQTILTQLSDKLKSTEGIDFPEKMTFGQTSADLNSQLENTNLSLSEVVTLEAQANTTLTDFTQKFDEARKSQLAEGLKTAATDLQTAIDYLRKYNAGYNAAKSGEDFQAKANDLSKAENYNAISYDEMKAKIDELNKQADEVRKTESQIKKDEADRIAKQEAQQRQALANAGISAPEAPIKGLNKLLYGVISQQRVYAYENDKLVMSSPVVSGKPGFETVTGTYHIYYKKLNATLKSPFPNIEYSVPVKYWMPFFDGYGFHDAPWRGSAFGGNIYMTNGSHGCFNSPPWFAAWLWNWAPIGTTVYIVN